MDKLRVHPNCKQTAQALGKFCGVFLKYYTISHNIYRYLTILTVSALVITLIILLVLAVFSCLSIYFNAEEVDQDDDNF
jgi:hypothetical protein